MNGFVRTVPTIFTNSSLFNDFPFSDCFYEVKTLVDASFDVDKNFYWLDPNFIAAGVLFV